MRRSYIHLLGGVLFSLPLLFASCGNGDNALEEIIKNGGTSSGGSGGGGGSSTISVTGITLDESLKVLVKDGDALTITATVTPSDATDKSVTWTSEDPAVATVDNGVVTPVGLGITKITAKSGDKEATCEVFVGKVVNLSTKTENYTVAEYDILIGALNSSNSITIPNNCKVAFAGVTTASSITCSGNATIILVDGSENTVSVGGDDKAGIKIGGVGTTLTINAETLGTGILEATGGSGGGAGIGTGKTADAAVTCGSIEINGGVIKATGGDGAAGIGTGKCKSTSSNASSTCGDITINGGTVTATGGEKAAGIGTGIADETSGYSYSNINKCGAITITANVKSVTAQKGEYSDPSKNNSIGKGVAYGGEQACGTITFGNVEVFNGATNLWDPNPMVAGSYGGLKLTISTTTNANDTWTLTPVAP